MDYTVRDHGSWLPYTKSEVVSAEGFPLVPAGTIFCKRDGDDVDWYDYSQDPDNFEAGSVKITLYDVQGLGLVTQAVYLDHRIVFPQNNRLIEVLGWQGERPHQTFERSIYDPATQTFSPIPVPVAPVITYKKDIWLRATDGEAEMIEQVLAQQSIRKQRIFNEAQYLDHADPLFAELSAGFEQAVGAERASQLLAGS